MDKEQFKQIIHRLKEDMQLMRTSRANPAMVENISVQAYNATMTLQELASIHTPEPQLLVIQPWDKSLLKPIETALQESDLHLNPVVDSDLIRIAFPPLTEEKRKELVKQMHEKTEDSRIAIRKVREHILKELKAQEKNGEISEDEFFREEKMIQQLVNEYNEKIEQLSTSKEKELMTI